ncbi:hypothetical protein BDV26DRAFT_272665 [Aspergillus bertholletiae]|uniref:Uncharacterized protein n=1 Tax=Aspergillus bertholletiae TaxID=1226010 RepID=A0A5N7AWL6_9EURO|nr:hypothetical protein BDV26DRAFT_272665 [Aspergillus bertholletiae]
MIRPVWTVEGNGDYLSGGRENPNYCGIIVDGGGGRRCYSSASSVVGQRKYTRLL